MTRRLRRAEITALVTIASFGVHLRPVGAQVVGRCETSDEQKELATVLDVWDKDRPYFDNKRRQFEKFNTLPRLATDLANGASVRRPECLEPFVAQLLSELSDQVASVLTEGGMPSSIARIVAMEIAGREVGGLRRALEARSSVPLPSKAASQLTTATQGAVKAILAAPAPPRVSLFTSVSFRQDARLSAHASGSEPNAQVADALTHLKGEFKASIEALPKREQAEIRSMIDETLRKGIPPNVAALPEQHALDAIKSLASLRTAQREFTARLNETFSRLGAEASAAAEVLPDMLDNLGKGLEAKLKAAAEIDASLEEELSRHRQAISAFQQAFVTGDLSIIARPDVASLVKSLPGGDKLGSLLDLGTALKGSQGNYVAKAQALVGVLSRIPGLESLGGLSQALSQVAPLVQAMAPLASIASFATGIGPIAAVLGGGLFGGGGGVDLPGIQRSLEQIQRQLDEVISKLEVLDKRIDAGFKQLSHAVQAVHFDTIRILDALMDEHWRAYQAGCSQATTLLGKGRLAADETAALEGALASCSKSLSLFTERPAAPIIASVRLLLESRTDRKAFDEFQNLIHLLGPIRSSFDIPAATCIALLRGSESMLEMEEVLARLRKMTMPTDAEAYCSRLANTNALIDPRGIRSQIELELGLARAILSRNDWKSRWHPRIGRARWAREAAYATLAVGQHSLLSGDAALEAWLTLARDPALAERASSSAGEKADFGSVLSSNGLLTANLARYWVWRNIRRTYKPAGQTSRFGIHVPGAMTGYSVAYAARDPELWALLSGSDARVSFALASPSASSQPRTPVPEVPTATDAVGGCGTVTSAKAAATTTAASQPHPGWTLKFAELPAAGEQRDGRVVLATPDELLNGALKRPPAVTALARQRDLLALSAGTIGWRPARDYLGALAIEWLRLRASRSAARPGAPAQ